MIGYSVGRKGVDMRLIAGISVPDSPLITEVLEYAQTVYEPISSITGLASS